MECGSCVGVVLLVKGSAFTSYGDGIAVAVEERVAPRLIKVMRHHLVDHLVERDLRYPPEICLGFRRVAEEGFNFSRTEVPGIDTDYWFIRRAEWDGWDGWDGLPRRFAPRNDRGGRARNDRGGGLAMAASSGFVMTG